MKKDLSSVVKADRTPEQPQRDGQRDRQTDSYTSKPVVFKPRPAEDWLKYTIFK
jgi:hypothetical protein